MTVRIDSIKERESKALFAQSYKRTLAPYENPPSRHTTDTVAPREKKIIPFDSLYQTQDDVLKASLLDHAKNSVDRLYVNYMYKTQELKYEDKDLRWHHAEMHRKFTLSIACLIFFFIGAPLGAIIRKGGLGAPAVISVFLFIVYYVIDTFGYKFAREAVWLPWQGMWLSSTVLLPLGVFLTYKAVNDSVILNAETYIDTFKRLIGKREMRKIEKKEIIIESPDYIEVDRLLNQLKITCIAFSATSKRWPNYFQYWKSGGIDHEAEQISNQVEQVVEILKNSDQNIILNKLMDFPFITNYQPATLRISEKTGLIMAVVFPLGGLIYLMAIYRRKLLHQDINTTAKVCNEMAELIRNDI